MCKKIPSAITGITLNQATFAEAPITDLTFINFFFGNNGAGKSTIARAIENDDSGIMWADGKSAADYDILVYNQGFISRNLVKFGQLPGVFIFGEEDAEAHQRIEVLTEKRKQKTDEKTAAQDAYKRKKAELDAAISDFQDLCFKNTAELRGRFTKALDGKKTKSGFAEAILGIIEPIASEMDELTRLYDVAFDDSARTYSEFTRPRTLDDCISMRGHSLLGTPIVSSGETAFARFINALGEAASDWVRDGHTHYIGTSDGKCPFCQQKLPENFEAEIAACFDAQYQEDTDDIAKFQAAYIRLTEETIHVLRANLDDAMPSTDLESYRQSVTLLEGLITINRERIADKVKEPSKPITLEDTANALQAVVDLIEKINQQIRANNSVVNEKRSSKSKCKSSVIQHLAYLLSEDVRRYRELQARLNRELEEITANGKSLKQEIEAIDAEIAALNRRNVNTAAAIDSINRILRDSGFQGFYLRAKKNVENVYEVVRENGSIADNLSEGERNFITFLYFYHQVRGSMSSDRMKEKIVVIDDPVSSMDSTALFIVSAIIREMIEVCRNNVIYEEEKRKVPGDYIKQLFILTHNAYFHKEITYRQVGHYKTASFYIIRKSGNQSTVKPCIRPNPRMAGEQENYNPVQNSYAALWDELRCVTSAIPAMNIMRRILEYYFLQLCGYEGSDIRQIVLERKENREKLIKGMDTDHPDMTDYELASALLLYINNPEGISDGLHYVEQYDDVGAYKRVFELIFDALDQSQHYKMMTGKRMEY